MSSEFCMSAKNRKSSSTKNGNVTRSDRDRRVRQNERMARVLRLLNLIQSRSRWNARALASELECSERTIYRDLEVLEFSGVPWFFDENDQCYRLRADFRFPTLTLTDDEVLGQAMATAISKAPGLDVSVGAAPTTAKLAASSEELQSLLIDASRLIEVLDLKLADHSKAHASIQTIQKALLGKKQVCGTYESPYKSKRVRLKVHPYRLCLIKQAWYLIGLSDGRQEVKCYRVARFKSLRMTDHVAVIPLDFDVREHFGNAWSVYRGTPTHKVKLLFDSSVAVQITETIWHHTQRVQRHRDGSVTLKFIVDGLEEIVQWVMGWSDSVVVEEPAELRELLVSKLRKSVSINS